MCSRSIAVAAVFSGKAPPEFTTWLDPLAGAAIRGVVVSRIKRLERGLLGDVEPVGDPQTVHQSKFSMGTVLGLIAVHGRAGLAEFDIHFQDPAVLAFRDRVEMVADAEVEAAYPARWIGKVSVHTRDGRTFSARVDEPKGDSGNTLDRTELESKAMQLAHYRAGATPAEMRDVIARVWSLTTLAHMPMLLPPGVR